MQQSVFLLAVLALLGAATQGYKLHGKDFNLSDAQLDTLKEILEHTELPDLPKNVTVNDLIEMMGTKTADKSDETVVRKAREVVEKVSEYWCCQIPRPGDALVTVVKMKLVTKQTTYACTRSCGFLGTSRCASECVSNYPAPVYFVDTVPITPPKWQDGCPQENIVCCNNLLFYQAGRSCITLDEWKDLIRFLHELGLLTAADARDILLGANGPPAIGDGN